MILGNLLPALLLTATTALAPAPRVDGFVLTHLPTGVGPLVSTFDYEWDEVTFRSYVRERGPDPHGAHTVDLTVKVLRGARLSDLAATREFLAGYHEQDATTWAPFDHHGQPGHRRPGAVFWWVEPGVAVEVGLDVERFGADELVATALGVRAAPPVPGPRGPDGGP